MFRISIMTNTAYAVEIGKDIWDLKLAAEDIQTLIDQGEVVHLVGDLETFADEFDIPEEEIVIVEPEED